MEPKALSPPKSTAIDPHPKRSALVFALVTSTITGVRQRAKPIVVESVVTPISGPTAAAANCPPQATAPSRGRAGW